MVAPSTCVVEKSGCACFPERFVRQAEFVIGMIEGNAALYLRESKCDNLVAFSAQATPLARTWHPARTSPAAALWIGTSSRRRGAVGRMAPHCSRSERCRQNPISALVRQQSDVLPAANPFAQPLNV